MTRFQKGYLHIFTISLLLCWSPSNVLAYLAPFVALFWLMFVVRWETVARNVLLIACAWLAFALVWEVCHQEFVFGNAIIAFLTLGSFIPILAIPSRYVANPALLKKLMRVLAIVVVIEGTLGITQALYGATITGGFDLSNGDFVEGTIHPWLEAELAFSNPMFAVLMATSILFLITSHLLGGGKYKTALLIGSVSFVMASVLHVILFFIVSVGLAYLLYRPGIISLKGRMRRAFVVFTVGILLPIMTVNILATNVSTIRGYAIALSEGQLSKTLIMYRFFTEVQKDYPHSLYVGLGPGQYISRASLIGSDMYFGGALSSRKSPLPFGAKSKPFEQYVEDLWIQVHIRAQQGLSGSTRQPQSSWNSTISEFGLVGFAAILFLVARLLWRIRNCARTRDDRILAFSLGSGVLLLFFLGTQENYWEVTQAIFPGLLLMKMAYAILIHSRAIPSPNVARN